MYLLDDICYKLVSMEELQLLPEFHKKIDCLKRLCVIAVSPNERGVMII